MSFKRILILALTVLTIPCFAAQDAHPKSSHVSENEVVEIILALPDVKKFKKDLKSGRSKLGVMVEQAPSKQNPYYIIKVYESFPDRIVTFNRYRYTPATQEIAIQDLTSEQEWNVLPKGARISQ